MTRTDDGKRHVFREDQRAILYLNVIGGVLLIFGGLWCATQWAASALAHQPQLGAPLFSLAGYRVYVPWRIFQWDYYYGAYAPGLFFTSYLWIYGAFFAEVFLMVALAVWRARAQKAGDAYGSARWETARGLKRAGLLDGKGIVLGQTPEGALIQHDGPEHALATAGPRTGKGVGLVIPTLLSWPGSVVVNDVKRENWLRTACFRSTFSHVLKFEPTSRESIHYNPLFEIRKGDNEFRDTQAIADMLMDNGEPHQRLDHWQRTGKALFIAVILHVLYAEKDKSLPGVANFLSNPERGDEDTLSYMMTTKHLGDRPHPIVASLTREVIEKAENELSGVVSTARSFLTLYRDPVIASNIRDSHFRIRDLMHLDSPVSLYLTVPASDVDRVKPLTRIMLNQIGRRLTESLSDVHDKPDYKHRLLLMLDEFATFGYMAFFESELAYLPGYGIRAFLIVQSLNQIDKYYGQNNAILDNCSIRITYGATDERTAERISKLTGQSTQVRRMANYAGSRLAPFLMHVMYSEQESPRPLLTPGEVLNLPDDDSLVMIGNRSPYYARKVRFYNDPRFATRAHHQGHEALPPSTADALRAECPPYTPCAWETLPSGNVSHETRSAKPPAETSSPTMQREDTLAAPLNEHTDWDLQTAAESRGTACEHDVTDPQNLSDEDRETAMEKERERVQRLRHQRARSAALGRDAGGLPL